MLAALAVLTSLTLAPGQGDGLALAGARLTHGLLGPDRADARFLPGDAVFLTFDIDGLTFGPDGKAAYATATELTDAAGQVIFHAPPRDQAVTLALGGHSLPAYARADLSLEQPPGDYALTVTVTDKASGKSQTLTRKFQVLPQAFGLVGLAATADRDGTLPACPPAVGATLWLAAGAVNFRRGGTGQPKLALRLRVLDEQGQPTLPTPFTGRMDRDVPASATALPVQFALALTRPGTFTVELTATDELAGQTATVRYPLVVRPAR
jgi:hypothetical protein